MFLFSPRCFCHRFLRPGFGSQALSPTPTTGVNGGIKVSISAILFGSELLSVSGHRGGGIGGDREVPADVTTADTRGVKAATEKRVIKISGRRV